MPDDVLLGQIEALRQELHRASAAIDSSALDRGLRERVGPRLNTELARLLARAGKLSEGVDSAVDVTGTWRDFYELQTAAGRLLDEVLAFVQGALARAQRLDEGMCALTDALLDDLAASADVSWRRFTLLATNELYRDIADIIRIKYPDVSPWSMPLAAHEFGHYVGQQLQIQTDDGRAYPFQDRLKRADETRGTAAHSKAWFHLQEHFADIFATYTLGPAYAAALMFLRLNPVQASTDSWTHPAPAARMQAIFVSLDRVASQYESVLTTSMAPVTERLRERWQRLVESTGNRQPLSDADALLAGTRAGELLSLLQDATAPELQFGRQAWANAQQLASALTESLNSYGRMTGPPPVASASRREVLNALWLARLSGAYDPRAIRDLGDAGLKMFRALPSPQGRVSIV